VRDSHSHLTNGERRNKRGKEDNVKQDRTIDVSVGIARYARVAFATAPGKRHEC
jgi:hypothetical protein